MDRARPTKTRATAKLRARQFQRVAQHPKQGRLGCNVHLPLAAVDVQSDGCHAFGSSGYGKTSYSTSKEKGNGGAEQAMSRCRCKRWVEAYEDNVGGCGQLPDRPQKRTAADPFILRD